MSKPRALVLSTGKAAFDEARAKVADEVEYVDLVRAGGGPSGAAAVVPAFRPEQETLDVVDRVMARKPFTHVLSTSESNIAFAAFLRSTYGLDGMRFEQALTVTNKWRMKQHFRGVLPMASYWLSGDFVEGAGWRACPPSVVVKPLSGSSSKGVRRLPAREALAYLEAQDGLLLVEEAIGVDCEFQCNGIVRDGGIRVLLPAVYDRPVLEAVGANVGSIHLPRSDHRWKKVAAATERVVGALDIADYVFHLELMESGGELLFGEIGLRPVGGGVATSLQRFHGVDLWEEHIRADLGLPSRAVSSPAEEGYCGAVGIAAGTTDGELPLKVEEALAIPGIVDISPWHSDSRARSAVSSGSSVGFTHLALFASREERDVLTAITRLRSVSPVHR